jgi:hypothetical protein
MGIWIVLLQMGLTPQIGKGLTQSKSAARGRLKLPFITAEGPGTAVILHSSRVRDADEEFGRWFSTRSSLD